MANLKTHTMTESEEMYLITIAHLGEMGHTEPIPLSKIADALNVQPVSVNQMIRKLEKENLVEYIPYKGVKFQPIGRRWAQQVLRYRRLWEVFFVKHLNLSPDEADELACHMEHITPEKVAEQLSKFLENPMHSPQGFLIPGAVAPTKEKQWKPLSEFHAGDTVIIAALPEEETTNSFLRGQHIFKNTKLTIQAIGKEKNMLIKVDGKRIELNKEITDQILISTHEALK